MEHTRPVAVRISSIAHATEDTSKVLSAISNLYPSTLSRKLETTRTKGHFGNEIRMFRLEARNVSQTESFLRSILSKLSRGDQQTLWEELDEHLDPSGSLHLRFDKQDAFRGVLALGDSDPIKVEVSFESRGMTANLLREKIAREVRELFNQSQGEASGRAEDADY
jgi:RNA-binding protein